MAIPSDCVWEVNTTGSDTAAGGGFSTAQKGATGVDKTYPTPTVTTFTSNLSAVGTTALTCASALFTNTMLGNVIQISGQGFYCIQGFTSTTVVTVDRALGTFAATSGWVGGALASPGQAGALTTAGNSVWVKSGTYLITSASNNVSGGCVSTSVSISWQGYQTTRSDLGTAPILQASGISTATIVTHSSQAGQFVNLTVDGNLLTSIQGFNLNGGGNGGYGYLLTAKNCTNTGINAPRDLLVKCTATGCTTTGQGIAAQSMFLCESYSNSVTGITLAGVGGAAGIAAFCLSYSNSGASSDGFSGSTVGGMLLGCVAYANGRDGFRLNSAGCGAANCIAEANTGRGFNYANVYEFTLNCATYNNSAGATTGTAGAVSVTPAALSASPFTAAASANFALNNTASAGASCRAAGIPGAYPRGLTTGYPDIGAAQSLATGGISRGRQVMD